MRQFVGAMWPAESEADSELPLLSSAERALFLKLSPAYRRHSLRVVARLRERGLADPDLLLAGLLHDVGKSAAQIRLHHRVLAVLMSRLCPRLLARIGTDGTTGWSRPLHVQANHALLGAELLEAAGTRGEVVRLVAQHHAAPAAGDPPRLVALRWADGKE